MQLIKFDFPNGPTLNIKVGDAPRCQAIKIGFPTCPTRMGRLS